MGYTRISHPTTTINNAKQRLLNEIKAGQIYDIVEYEVWMNDDITRAEQAINEELKEKGIELPEHIEIDSFIVVAQYEIAKKEILKMLDRKALTDDERAEISMLNTLYPIAVAVKGVLIDEFKL